MVGAELGPMPHIPGADWSRNDCISIKLNAFSSSLGSLATIIMLPCS